MHFCWKSMNGFMIQMHVYFRVLLLLIYNKVREKERKLFKNILLKKKLNLV